MVALKRKGPLRIRWHGSHSAVIFSRVQVLSHLPLIVTLSLEGCTGFQPRVERNGDGASSVEQCCRILYWKIPSLRTNCYHVELMECSIFQQTSKDRLCLTEFVYVTACWCITRIYLFGIMYFESKKSWNVSLQYFNEYRDRLPWRWYFDPEFDYPNRWNSHVSKAKGTTKWDLRDLLVTQFSYERTKRPTSNN